MTTATETPEATATAPIVEPPSRRRGFLGAIAGLLAVVLVALIAVTVVELARARTSSAKEKAGQQALAAAIADFPKISSYSYATIDADMARAKSVFTPSLQKEYNKIFGSLVQTLQQQKVVVTSQVQQAQALSIDSTTSVHVLVFFTQQVAKPSASAPGVTPGGYALTMTKLNGTWLIGSANALG